MSHLSSAHPLLMGSSMGEKRHLHLHQACPGPLPGAHFPQEHAERIDVHRLAKASGGEELWRHVRDGAKGARADGLL